MRAEQREIHPVAQHPDALGADPDFDHPLLQPAGNGDQPIGPVRRPADPAARNRVVGDQIEVAAPGGDHDRAAERLSEQHGGNPVGIKIVRVDQIKVPPLPQLPAQKRTGLPRKARAAPRSSRSWAAADSADGRYRGRAGSRSSGCPGESGVVAEPFGSEGKPRAGRDHPGADGAAFDEFSQPRLDKDPVLRPGRARIQRREGQDAHACCAWHWAGSITAEAHVPSRRPRESGGYGKLSEPAALDARFPRA